MGAATLAGSETTALTIAWLLHHLAQDPPTYSRARTEVLVALNLSHKMDSKIRFLKSISLQICQRMRGEKRIG